MLDPVKAEQFAQWLEQRGLRTPISQVVGFQQFVGQPAPDVLTQESTASAAYTDLATVGPSLNLLGNGRYLILFGYSAAGATPGLMSVSVNGSGGSDATCCQASGSAFGAPMRALAVTLTSSPNTVVAKYRTPAGINATFLNRWLFALRYGN